MWAGLDRRQGGRLVFLVSARRPRLRRADTGTDRASQLLMPTKAEVEDELTDAKSQLSDVKSQLADVKSQLAAVKSGCQSQQSLLLRAFGNNSLFDEPPVKELVPLLRAAHAAGAKAAAEAIAKAICSTADRASKMEGAWMLTLRYLPDGDGATRCVFQVLRWWDQWSKFAITKDELDFCSMCRVLQKLPKERHTASATQTTECTVENLNHLPAHGQWQRLEDIECRSYVSEENEQFYLGIKVRYHGSCESVVACFSNQTSTAGAPAEWGRRNHVQLFSSGTIGRFAPKASVQVDNAFAFEGSFQLAKSAPRTQLFTLLLGATSGAASDDAFGRAPVGGRVAARHGGLRRGQGKRMRRPPAPDGVVRLLRALGSSRDASCAAARAAASVRRGQHADRGADAARARAVARRAGARGQGGRRGAAGAALGVASRAARHAVAGGGRRARQVRRGRSLRQCVA